MICKIFLVIIVFLSSVVFGAEFGQYQYSKYIGLQQQIKNRQIMAQQKRYRYNVSPTRNIRYPNSSNPYPNIQKTNSQQLNAYQRYSPSYYQRTYQNNY